MIGYVKYKKENTLIHKIKNVVVALIVPISVLVFWEWIVKAGFVKATLLPPPTRLWENFISLVSSGDLQNGLIISFGRVITGFMIGSLAAVILGFLMGLFSTMNQALSIIVNVLRPIPTIALIPIFIIIFGIGEKSNIAVIIVGAFWSVLLNTISGIQSVDAKLLELAYVYRINSARTVFRIILPSAVMSILTGLRLGLGAAWMSVVAAEMIGASSGIGYMIMFSRELAQTANMYVEVLIIGFVGLAIDRILLVIQNKLNKKFKGIAD
ncbi:MAG: ABC transporter permease [Lachnospiraceae bacterium]|nr:ABC transporter permease [Lachnospiraceae bacterium]